MEEANKQQECENEENEKTKGQATIFISMRANSVFIFTSNK